jgi:hypothetical protein
LYNSSLGFGTIVNQTNYTDGTTEFNWTSLPNGHYYYEVNVTNGIGTNSSGILYLTLDTQSPVIGKSYPSNASGIAYINTNTIPFNFSVNDSTSGVYNATIQIYNNLTGALVNNTTRTSPSELDLNNNNLSITITLPDGIYNWDISAYDFANNFVDPNDTFIVDANAPNATNIAPINTTNISNGSFINFTVSANDSLGLKNATLFIYNATGLYNNTSTTNFSPEGVLSQTIGVVLSVLDGSYNWFFRVFDIGLLSTDTENFTLEVLSVYPVLNITFPVNGAVYNNSAQVSLLNYTVTGLNLSSCWYDVNGALNYSALASAGTNFTVIPQNGNNTYTVF